MYLYFIYIIILYNIIEIDINVCEMEQNSYFKSRLYIWCCVWTRSKVCTTINTVSLKKC